MPSSKPHRLLITVLTYPHPSNKYQEIICTAGVTAEGQWIRLYPLPIRVLPADQQIRKWQWIELNLFDHDLSHDKRPESRRPEWDSIRIFERLDSSNNHFLRREIVDRLPVRTLAEWQVLEANGVSSLGVVKPLKILEVTVSPEEEVDWNEKQREALQRTNLFSDRMLTLDRIPFKFHVRFIDQNSEEEKLLITDWEIGALYRNVRKNHDPRTAAKMTADHYTNEVFAEDRDVSLFIGTHHRFHHFMAIGVFWPKKELQDSLFSGSIF